MKKIGISTWQLQEKYGDFKALEIAKSIGADAVDFAMANKRFDYRVEGSLYNKSDEEIIKYFSELKAYADELGIFVCQTHGHDCGFKNKKEEDDALVENIRLNLLATAALGAPVCVIHNATSLHMGANPDPELMHSLSYDLFTRTLPYAKQYNVKLATETFGDAYKNIDFFGDIDEFMKAYNAIKQIDDLKDYFTTCVDTGHSNKAAVLFGQPKPADVIRRIGSDIAVLHLNDNDGIYDQHKMPKSGNIDWKDVLKALDEVGYDGVYNMELKLNHFSEDLLIETAEFSIKVLKEMLK
ncbi:MAG: sugar phosphate isomerase/epimerase [Clostridia bacterium]|nr:sugar phosphate isomerase/epimerase [Clostridia bacterium]